MKQLYSALIRASTVKWQRVLEDTRFLKGTFCKVALWNYHKLTKENCLAVHALAKRIYSMGRRSGWLHVSVYLKHASACLMMAHGGNPKSSYPFRISLNRSGYPRIIPRYHRKVLMGKDSRRDMICKLYLSLFSVNKIILLAPKITKKTFASIITPLTETVENTLSEFVSNELRPRVRNLLLRYIPRLKSIPLVQGMSWMPSWSVLPTYGSWGLRHIPKEDRPPKSPYLYLPLELKVFGSLLRFTHLKGEQYSPLCLWASFTRFGMDIKGNNWISNRSLDMCEATWAPHAPNCGENPGFFSFGRLGQSIEGRAKRRIFAMGNYLCQRLLKPFHEWLMKLLSTLPMDGTFDQPAPLKRLVGERHIHSFDLSAATDRFPLRVIFHVIEGMLGSVTASAVVNATLASHVFDVPFVKSKKGPPRTVSFIVGQALGFHGSWPSFALAHHLIVWCAAERVYPNKVFTRYAVLGDDVIIADDCVATEYSTIMASMGVEISAVKSLISCSGAGEFAKRFMVNDMSVDVSPLSVKVVLSCYHPFGIYALGMMQPDLPLNVALRLSGCGFRTRSKPLHLLGIKYKRICDMLSKIHLPLDLWMTDSLPFDPYRLGVLVLELLQEVKIPEPEWPPERWFHPDAQWASDHFIEVTMMRNQMVQWLRYQKWYSELWLDYLNGVDPFSLIERLCKPPIFYFNWKPPTLQDNNVLKRFGISFKIKIRYHKAPSRKALSQSVGNVEGEASNGSSGQRLASEVTFSLEKALLIREPLETSIYLYSNIGGSQFVDHKTLDVSDR